MVITFSFIPSYNTSQNFNIYNTVSTRMCLSADSFSTQKEDSASKIQQQKICSVTGLLCLVTGVLCSLTDVLCFVTGVLCSVNGVLFSVTGVLCLVTGVLCNQNNSMTVT
jgi:hypothetical protein